METYTFVALGPQCWGKGPTLEEALSNAKSAASFHGKTNSKNYSIWKFGCESKEISISEFDGTILTPKGISKEKIQTSKLAN